ncbi:hypothetical protein [Streptomyces sp. NPDC060322]|uniref:hypothetical protein n=1 Tax=Streptomyces sp. NPDC060322 TaxID=3347097 RepID=UPI003667628B
MVIDGVHLPAAGRRELLRLIRSLPKAEPSSPFAPRLLAQPAGGPGAWIIRMLQYRNLSWTGMAHLLAVVTPTYPSAATYGVIGAGRTGLTPRPVTYLARLLGMDPGELAALPGVVLAGAPPPPAPEVEDAAALLWEARRLSAAQACHVSGLARSMRGDSADGYRVNLPAS